MSLDGFVAGPNGELDWMTWEHDDEILKFINTLTDTSDTILLGRKMTDGFVNYWENIVNNQPNSPEFTFAKKMVDIPKIVFTKTLDQSRWNNTRLAKGKLADEIANLKKQNGKDIVVYGGANFVSSLIREGHIDEYHLFINPTAIGKGLTIFSDRTDKLRLKRTNSKAYDCGVVVNTYVPQDR